MIPPSKLGWMAAAIDLKGSIIIKRNQQRATPQIVLAVTSKNYRIIQEMASLTGTKPEPHSPQFESNLVFNRRGCVEHCPEAHIHQDRTLLPATHIWTVTGVAAAIVLHNLEPYLVTDDKGFHEITEQIIERTDPNGRGSGAVRATVRRLIELGWEVPMDLTKKLSAENFAAITNGETKSKAVTTST